MRGLAVLVSIVVFMHSGLAVLWRTCGAQTDAVLRLI
jgi:hypothetical protein